MRVRKRFLVGVASLVLVAVSVSLLRGQGPELETVPVPPGASEHEPIDVLGRGPVHEAFAELVNPDVEAGLVVPKAPPEPIDEIPPDMKPDGDDVIWISGYWFWDEDRSDYVWVSGVWRRVPPGSRWVPGYWQSTPGGHQWVAGFWSPVDAREIEYLEPPPATLETGPVSPAPSSDSFWVPGNWVYANHAFRWRPGFWHDYRDGWIWVNARYVWTPRGCVFVPGYWDYALTRRGLLFAPVYFRAPVYRTVGFCYRPAFWITYDSLLLHLFVCPRSYHLYFGDFYAPIYRQRHFEPCYQFHRQHCGFSSLYVYYEHHYRRDGIDYPGRVRDWHAYYARHEHDRPPVTFDQQVEREEVHGRDRRPRMEFVVQPYQPKPSDRVGNHVVTRVTGERYEQLRREALELRSLTTTRQRIERGRSDEDSAGRGPGVERVVRRDRLVLPELPTDSSGRVSLLRVPEIPQLDRAMDSPPATARSRNGKPGEDSRARIGQVRNLNPTPEAPGQLEAGSPIAQDADQQGANRGSQPSTIARPTDPVPPQLTPPVSESPGPARVRELLESGAPRGVRHGPIQRKTPARRPRTGPEPSIRADSQPTDRVIPRAGSSDALRVRNSTPSVPTPKAGSIGTPRVRSAPPGEAAQQTGAQATPDPGSMSPPRVSITPPGEPIPGTGSVAAPGVPVLPPGGTARQLGGQDTPGAGSIVVPRLPTMPQGGGATPRGRSSGIMRGPTASPDGPEKARVGPSMGPPAANPARPNRARGTSDAVGGAPPLRSYESAASPAHSPPAVPRATGMARSGGLRATSRGEGVGSSSGGPTGRPSAGERGSRSRGS